MRHLVVLAIALLGFSYSSRAQVVGGSHEKLFDLFIQEKFDDCYYKALKMTENEKYRTDPEPYLYVSMCCLKFEESPEDKEDYVDGGGDPLKDALKFAAKAVKIHAKCIKKSIPTFAMEENLEFFQDLNRVALEEAIYQYNEDKYSKAASWAKKLTKVNPNEESVQIFTAANMLLSRNMEGQKIVDMYWPKMVERYGGGDEEPEESIRPAMIFGIIALSQYYNDSGQSLKAKEIIQFGKDLFVDNNRINSQYESLHQ